MNHVYLLAGGNIGDRLHYLQKAANLLQKQVGTILQTSSVYETAPWGLTNQEPFLNQVLHIGSDLSAEEILQIIFDIEKHLGRERFYKNGPRTIDIDILFYNAEIIQTDNLVIPHPEIANRRFVLTPLHQIAPDFKHPVLQKTIKELLAVCSDQLEVREYLQVII